MKKYSGEIISKLLERTNDEIINKIEEGRHAKISILLIAIKQYKNKVTEELLMKILERTNNEVINTIINDSYVSVIMAGMIIKLPEEIIKKILERTNEEVINTMNKDKLSSLYLAIINKMSEEIIFLILEKKL